VTQPDPRSGRCALTARGRGDELIATAPPARRFVLLEVPGPWQPDAMVAAGLRPEVTAALRSAAGAAGARLLLIRRPGRHPVDPGRARRWGIAGPDGGLLWGEWRSDDELRELDVTAAVPAFDAATQRPLALVCTHGRHDLCCAVEGRPVAAAAHTVPEIDAWECSHLGGDRFAANLLFLPSGLLFGGLGPAETPAVLAAARDGRVLLEHFRGRCGDPVPAQAVQWLLMRELAEDRPERVVVEQVAKLPGAGLVGLARHAGRRYRVELAVGRTDPARLTCRAPGESRAHTYRLAAPPLPLPT
jgi:hypothetical protein